MCCYYGKRHIEIRKNHCRWRNAIDCFSIRLNIVQTTNSMSGIRLFFLLFHPSKFIQFAYHCLWHCTHFWAIIFQFLVGGPSKWLREEMDENSFKRWCWRCFLDNNRKPIELCVWTHKLYNSTRFIRSDQHFYQCTQIHLFYDHVIFGYCGCCCYYSIIVRRLQHILLLQNVLWYIAWSIYRHIFIWFGSITK